MSFDPYDQNGTGANAPAVPADAPALPRRSEVERIICFAFVTLGVGILCTLLSGVALQVLGAGMATAIAWGEHLVSALTGMLINRRVTFRSGGRLVMPVLVTLVVAFLWQMWTPSITGSLVGNAGPAARMGVTTAIDGLWLAVQYALQRFALFGKTLDMPRIPAKEE